MQKVYSLTTVLIFLCTLGTTVQSDSKKMNKFILCEATTLHSAGMPILTLKFEFVSETNYNLTMVDNSNFGHPIQRVISGGNFDVEFNGDVSQYTLKPTGQLTRSEHSGPALVEIDFVRRVLEFKTNQVSSFVESDGFDVPVKCHLKVLK